MIVFVTGASAGFGAAIVRRFAKDGASIIAAGRRLDRIEALAKEIGGKILPLQLDVRDRAAVERAVGGLPAGFREVSVLVNNAGLALGLEPAHKASIEDWEAMVATNVTKEKYNVANTGAWNSAGVAEIIPGQPRFYGVRVRYSFGQ